MLAGIVVLEAVVEDAAAAAAASGVVADCCGCLSFAFLDVVTILVLPALKCDVLLWRGQGFYSLIIMRAIVGVGVAGPESTEKSLTKSVSSGLFTCPC